MNAILQVWIDSKTLSHKEFKSKYIVSIKKQMQKDLTKEEKEWLQSRTTHAAELKNTPS